MDRYTNYGLRGDADETFRRAVRDGFKRAGLTPAQLTQAMEWYRDSGQHLGGDPAKLAESFSEFAASKGWQAEQQDAAVTVYGLIRDQGPAAVMAPAPSAEEDAATIARADELLGTDQAAYWKDEALQEAVLKARERQQAAPAPAPDAASPAAGEQIERQIAQQQCDKFAAMLRKPEEAAKYWASPQLQEQYRGALAAAQPPEVSVAPPVQAAVPEVAPPIAPEPGSPAEKP